MSSIIVGQFGSPYGIQGWIKVKSFTSPVQNILKYRPWKVCVSPAGFQSSSGQAWQELPLNATQFLANNHLIVQIEGCTSPEAVRRYSGLQIAVDSDLLPKLPVGEFYWSQLMGLQVFTVEGVELGWVDHLLETGSNDVLVVKNDKKIRMIPYLPKRVVQSVDLDSKKIVVDWDPEF